MSHDLGDCLEQVDDLFLKNVRLFGEDLPIYRGHVRRVVDLVDLQFPVTSETARPLAIAAFFHDAAIWTDGTWNYLPSSIARAVHELGGRDDRDADLVEALIGEHHRIRRARHPHPLVEAFRRADLADVTGGLVKVPGALRRDCRIVMARNPDKGFRPMLLHAFARGLRENPLKPAPMVRF